jgi:hypothetical protein
MIDLNTAIYNLYPTVVTIRGDIAYDKDNNEVAYDLANVTEKAKKTLCKQQAKQLLANSDWSVLPDVGLANQVDFDNYRKLVREYVINPVDEPTFPVEPKAVWK